MSGRLGPENEGEDPMSATERLSSAADFHGPDTPVKVVRAFVKHNVPQASGDLLYHMFDGDPDEVLGYLRADPDMADICGNDRALFGAPRRTEWRYPKGHESYAAWRGRQNPRRTKESR